MSRIIINIQDDTSELRAITHVLKVVEDGRVSVKGTKFCAMTVFHHFDYNVCVSVNERSKSDVFNVWSEKKK